MELNKAWYHMSNLHDLIGLENDDIECIKYCTAPRIEYEEQVELFTDQE